MILALRKSLVILLILSAGVAIAEDTPKPDPLAPAKAAMRNSKFADAIQALEKVAKNAPADVADEAGYLKALALYYDKKYDDAIDACEGGITRGEKNVWLRKTLFLKAQSLTRLRKFKEAEAIYSA